MKFEIIWLIIVGVAQFCIFYATYLKIELFKHAIPAVTNFKVSKSSAANGAQNVSEARSGAEQFNVVHCSIHGKVISCILNSINVYLERNKNAVTDFHLVKDITERNIDALEEDINLTISIPLYLGLIGTMLGIVIGLFTMSDISDATSGKITD